MHLSLVCRVIFGNTSWLVAVNCVFLAYIQVSLVASKMDTFHLPKLCLWLCTVSDSVFVRKLAHKMPYEKAIPWTIGLNRTGHMSFLTGQDQTPKFAGQFLPDRTKSGLIFLNIFIPSMIYWHKVGVKSSKLGYIQELKKINEKFIFGFSSIFNSAICPASGKENVPFPNSPES